MADKDSAEELARKKKAEAEIFGKTLGFTHTPSPEELERTVILTRAEPEQIAETDFESTVRFSNFDALVESTIANEKTPASPQPTPPAPPIQAKVPEPVPEAPKVEARQPEPIKTESKRVEPNIEPAHITPTPPKTELDFNDGDFGLSDSEPTEQPDADPYFDSGAALDELDELLKMEMPDDASADDSQPEPEQDPSAYTDSLGHALLDDNQDEDELDISIGSMPTVQLGAADLAIEDDGLLTAADDDDEQLSDYMIEDLDRDDPVTDERAAQDDLIDLSGFDASLEDDTKDIAHYSEADEPADEDSSLEKTDPGMADWEDTSTAAVEEEAEPEPDAEDALADQNKHEVEAMTEDTLAEEAADEPPAASPVPGESRLQPEEAPIVTHMPVEPASEKRGGSGFAIFLSLLALAGAGATYWFSQIAPGGSGAMPTQLEQQLAQTADRLSQVEQGNRQLATQVELLEQKNDALEQQLNDLTRVVANRTSAEQAQATSKKRPAIQPTTPLAPAKVTAPPPVEPPAAPKVEGWVINLTSVSSIESANQEVARLQQMGVPAEAVRTEARGKIWYRIRVSGIATKQAAEEQSILLGEQLGIKDIWVGKL